MIRLHSFTFIHGISLGFDITFNSELEEVDFEGMDFEEDEKHCSILTVDLLFVRLMVLIGG